MNRREAIKGLTTWGAMAIFPNLFPTGDVAGKTTATRPLHFVGLGGAGCNVLEHIHKKGIDAKYTCITTPPRNNLSAGINFIDYSPFGVNNGNENNPTNHASGRGQVPEITSNMINSLILMDRMPEGKDGKEDCTGPIPGSGIPGPVRQVFSHDHKYVLLAGLGGFTGTSLAVQLTPWLKETNKEFITICSLPFHFEGLKRRSYAENAMEKLQAIPNFSHYRLETLRRKYGDITIKDAFEKADEDFYRIYRKWVRA